MELSNSLEPLLPACYAKKPRNISIFSGTWRKAASSASAAASTTLFGSNPDRLMAQLITALNTARVHFARPGKYRLQFVFTPGTASGALEEAARRVQARVRVAVEVCHVFGTNSYVTRFKHLSPSNCTAAATEDFKLVTQSLVRLIRSASASPHSPPAQSAPPPPGVAAAATNSSP